jgi:hypothetical protein
LSVPPSASDGDEDDVAPWKPPRSPAPTTKLPFRLRVGGDPGVVTGPVLATITTASAIFELKSVTAPSFLQPGGVSLIKITAASDDPAHTCRIRSKSVVLLGA